MFDLQTPGKHVTACNRSEPTQVLAIPLVQIIAQEQTDS